MKTPLRLVSLGGADNVTSNMYCYEYDGKLLLVDCGIGFSDDPNASYIYVPDYDYILDRQQDIVGMVLTHGHDDHIGAIPYVFQHLDRNFPIFGSKLTIGFAQDRIREHNLDLNFQLLPKKEFQLGPFSIQSFDMTHSVPGTKHLLISTPVAKVYHGTDFRIDFQPIDGVRPNLQGIATASQLAQVDLMLCDCLNSEVEEFSTSESSLFDVFSREMRGVSGKVVITVMSSHIHRIQQILYVAREFNRKVTFVGRSLEQNIQTAIEHKYLKIPKRILLPKHKLDTIPANKSCIVIAGSQAQESSSLTRAAYGSHSLVKINHEDKVIFAADAIPGNEAAVNAAIDSLARTGADIVYPDINTAVHVSGHSSAIEQRLLMSLVKAKNVMPIGGNYRHMIEFRSLARSLGYNDKHISIPESNQVLAISGNKVWVDQELNIELKRVETDY